MAPGKVIDRSHRETRDLSRKILYTFLVPTNPVDSKVNAKSSRISSFRTRFPVYVGTQKLRSAVNRQPRIPPRGLVERFVLPCVQVFSVEVIKNVIDIIDDFL